MNLTEPIPTAILLAVFGMLMAASVFFSRAADRLGVPVVLLFMVIGMLAGSGGLGVQFDDFAFAFRVGTIALVLILFDGGLNTPLKVLKQGIAPASVLATIGVAGTAGLVGLGAWAMGLPLAHAMLLGAIVSSTDAATVFAVLRGSRLHLQRRVAITLEVESCINDPMAIILTMAIAEAILTSTPPGWELLWGVVVQLLIGTVLGIAVGFVGTMVLRRLRVTAGGLFPVMSLAVAMIAFGATTLVNGSGFMAVYAAGVIVGNSDVPYRSGLARIHDAIAWLGQITMFLMLGLLVHPPDLLAIAWMGIAIGLFASFIARPVVVALCILPFRYPPREMLYICWVGLRGAVPIILATFPVMANVPDGEKIFNLVFFVVVVSAFLPGATLRWLTRRLKLDVAEPPPPAAALEINSTQLLRGEILSFYIDETLAVTGVPLSRIHFPEGSSVLMVVRGNELMAARGYTVLEPGDHVYVFTRPENKPYVELLFGRPQQQE